MEALGLAGDYRFDGRQHHLAIGNVALAQGQYTARATLDAQAPMALDATVDGSVRRPCPAAAPAMQVQAHATQRHLVHRCRAVAAGCPAAPACQAAQPAAATPQTPGSAPTRQRTPSTRRRRRAEAMQAALRATLAPWAPQPVQQARATLRAVNLATL